MVQVSQQGDQIVLAYPNDGEITTEVIQGSKVLKETEKFKLKTNAENEKVTFSAQDNLMAWYGRHFLACGFQKIAPIKKHSLSTGGILPEQIDLQRNQPLPKPTRLPPEKTTDQDDKQIQDDAHHNAGHNREIKPTPFFTLIRISPGKTAQPTTTFRQRNKQRRQPTQVASQ